MANPDISGNRCRALLQFRHAADTVFARLRHRSFVPFRLILSSGTVYDIMHPEMLFVSKSGLTVAIYHRGQQPEPDEIPSREALVSYLHLAATEKYSNPSPNP